MCKMKRKAFTLVEIMLVVAIIGLLVAIAVPNFHKMRMKSNEAAAKAALQSIATAEISYHSEHSDYGTLTELDTDEYVDEDLEGDGTLKKHGYIFETPAGDISATNFCVIANPETFRTTGELAFCIYSSGSIRYKSCETGPCEIANLAECDDLPKVQ